MRQFIQLVICLLPLLFSLPLTAQVVVSEAVLSDVQIGVAGGGGPEIADTFTDTDGANLTNHVTTTGGYMWTNLSAQLEIRGNAVTNSAWASGTSGAFVGHAMSASDYTAQIDLTNVTSLASTEASLAIRYSGDALATRDAYFVSMFQEGFARLYKVVNGTATQLGTDLTITLSAVTNLWISVSGSTVTGKVNTLGAANLTGATDAGITANGYVGIGGWFRGSRDSSGFRYDNLTVTVP